MVPFLFSSLVLTICTLGYHILQISSTTLTTLMYQELLITSNYIEYACKASWSMITTSHVEITLIFFFMSIFNFDFQCRIFQCLFLMLIFDVDFQCCCLTIIFIVFFFLFLFWDFFSKYFSALIISLFIFLLYIIIFLLQHYFSPFFYFDCVYFSFLSIYCSFFLKNLHILL